MNENDPKAIPDGRAADHLRAVILAGGKGVRLRPFTVSFPKPLVPIGDKPIIEVLMQRLISFGITDITLTLGHLAELVKAYFHHRRQFTDKLKLSYIEEDEPTGTAGSLAFVEGLPTTLLEAMASRRAVVATDVGGATEAIRDGIDGLIVPPRNAAAIADAIQRIVNTPSLYTDLVESAYQRVQDRFSRRQMVCSTWNLIVANHTHKLILSPDA